MILGSAAQTRKPAHALPSRVATASARRPWPPGSFCGSSLPGRTRKSSSPPTPRRSLPPKPGANSPNGSAFSVFADTFTWTATRCYHKQAQSTWFAAAVPWRADRTEAFAGTHEEHVLLLMDEARPLTMASGKPREGMMTTPGSVWVAFGNPTQGHRQVQGVLPWGPLRASLAPSQSG